MFPPPPPPPPPLDPGPFKKDNSFETDWSKRLKSDKNRALKREEPLNMEKEIAQRMREIMQKNAAAGDDNDDDDERIDKHLKQVKKLPKKEQERLERDRLEKLRNAEAEKEIERRMAEASQQEKRKRISWQDSVDVISEKSAKPKKQKKMSKKEKQKEQQRLEKERLERLMSTGPETEIERRIGEMLQRESPIAGANVITKEDLRVNKIWTVEKSRFDVEKDRLSRELEKLDRDKRERELEMERKLADIKSRQDSRPNSVQGRVREAVLRQEREALEKVQMDQERKERSERARIMREKERVVREEREMERVERERIEREQREQREREIREMVRKQVEIELRRIPRRPGCCCQQSRNVMHCCMEFAETAPIEGCSGLANKNNSIIEKAFYLCTVLLSLYACMDMVIETFNKWQEAPFLTVEDENAMAVWKVPFPAVTVCSEVKIRRSILEYGTYFDDIGDMLERQIPRELFQKLVVSSTVCELPRNEGDELMTEEDLDILAEVMPNLESTITSCKWRGDVDDCSAFTTMFKDEGVCFNFNMLDREDIFREEVIHYSDFLYHGRKPVGWNLTHGYPKEEDTDTFPRRDRPSLPYPPVTHEEYNAGLVLMLLINKDDYEPVCSKEEGWRIYVHHPVEVPGIHSQYIKVEPNKDMTISLTPGSVSQEKLRKFPPDVRNCYFPYERNLTYYKTYTQQNCEMECLVNMTIDFCECVAFYMPRTNNTEICGPVRQMCVDRAKGCSLIKFQIHLVQQKYFSEYNRVFREAFSQNEIPTEKFIYDELGAHSKYFNIVVENITDPKCTCRPTCNWINYKISLEKQGFYANDTEPDPETETEQVARLVIRYKEKAFVPADKIEMYSFADFISAIGAVLGTFMGISLGKAAEMVFGNVVKIVKNIWRHGICHWAGPEEEE